MAQRKRDKLDGIDIDDIEQTTSSRGWQLIRQRIERTLAGKRAELEHDADSVATAKLRGFIEGLGLAMKVPAILVKEAQEKPKS